MKKYFNVLALLLPVFAVAQNPSFVQMQNGEAINFPGGFYHNNNEVIISKGTDWPHTANGLIVLSDQGLQELDIPWKATFFSYYADDYIDGVMAAADLYQVHQGKIYFQQREYNTNHGYKLLEYSPGSSKLKTILNSKSGTMAVAKYNNKIHVTRGFTSFTSSDTIASSYDLSTGTLSHDLNTNRFRNVANYIEYNGNLVYPKKYNTDGELGVFLYNDSSGTEISLLPSTLVDTTLAKEHSFIRSYNYQVHNGKLFFELVYISPDYHEYALYTSNGQAGDAKKVATIKDTWYEDNAGTLLPMELSIYPQPYTYHNGYVYFFAEKPGFDEIFHLHRTDGTVAGTSIISDKKLSPYIGMRNNIFQLMGDEIYFSGHEGSRAFVDNHNNLYSINTNTLEEKTHINDATVHTHIKALNDSLLFIMLSGSEFGFDFDYTLYNINSNTATSFDNEIRTYHNTLSQSALAGNHLYYTGSDKDGLPALKKYNIQATVTDVADFEELAWEIYPNPSSSVVRFTQAGLKENVDVKILDLNGRVLIQSNTAEAINISQLNSGVYFVQLSKQGEILGTKKLIRQ